MNLRWDAICSAEREHAGRWVSLPDNGWGAMLAYLAGPRWVRSRPRHHSSAKVTVEGRDGTVARFEEPFSERDREIVYSSAVEYLADAGIPAPPRDVSWQLALPETVSAEEFWRVVHEAQGAALDASNRDAREASTCPLFSVRIAVGDVLVKLLDEPPEVR